MGKVTHNTPVNPAQVITHLNLDGCTVRQHGTEWEVEADTTEQALTDALAVIVYDETAGTPPDPDDDLRLAIEGATDFASLKAALLGSKPGQAARVAGKAKGE